MMSLPRILCAATCLSLANLVTGVYATTYIVNPDGTGDFPSIQAALDGVVDGDVIELTDGVFIGNGNRDIDFRGKAVAVRSQSGSPDACVIDCEGSAQQPHRGFNFHSGEDLGSILEGVTIANGFNPDFAGAIYCDDGSSPLIRNCVLLHNHADQAGALGTIYSSPSIVQCSFIENSAGAAISCCWESHVRLVGCEFTDNAGGAIYT